MGWDGGRSIGRVSIPTADPGIDDSPGASKYFAFLSLSLSCVWFPPPCFSFIIPYLSLNFLDFSVPLTGSACSRWREGLDVLCMMYRVARSSSYLVPPVPGRRGRGMIPPEFRMTYNFLSLGVDVSRERASEPF